MSVVFTVFKRGCNFQTITHSRSLKIWKSARSASVDLKLSKPSTIDKDEVKSFSDIMKTWWDTDGPMKGLHTFNEIRIPFIVNGMKQNMSQEIQFIRKLKILDVGCGGGILSEALAKQGLEVTGIDASSELIDAAIQHSQSCSHRPTYHCTTIEDHAEKNNNLYDGIVASEVIEHVNNQDLFVKSCVQALKPNGRIFFTTPSKTRLSQLYLILIAENVLNNPPKGTHQYEKFISGDILGRLLEKNGCQIEFTRGCFVNLITNKWSWTKNQNFFYTLQAKKIINILS